MGKREGRFSDKNSEVTGRTLGITEKYECFIIAVKGLSEEDRRVGGF